MDLDLTTMESIRDQGKKRKWGSSHNVASSFFLEMMLGSNINYFISWKEVFGRALLEFYLDHP